MWQSYKQERDCLMHFARLANTLLNDGESARNYHVTLPNIHRFSSYFLVFLFSTLVVVVGF